MQNDTPPETPIIPNLRCLRQPIIDNITIKVRKVNPIIEIYRYLLLINIRNNFTKILKSYSKNISSRDITNIFVRYILLQIAHNRNNIDCLIPYQGNFYSQLRKDIINIVISHPHTQINSVHILPKQRQPNENIKSKEISIKESTVKNIQNKFVLDYANDIIKKLKLAQNCNKALFKLFEFIETNHNNKFKYRIMKYYNKNNVKYNIKINNQLATKIWNINTKFGFNNDKVLFYPLFTTIRNYKKLINLFGKNNSNRHTDKQLSNVPLDEIIFCLLLRYKTLNLNTFGLAVPSKVLDMASKELNIKTELFASPLNHHLPQYGSIFRDLEKYFKSWGSFFNIKIKRGHYEVNPPFDEEIIRLTIKRLIITLESTKKPILILLIIPAWKTKNNYGVYQGYKLLQEHNHLITFQIKLKKNEHLYYNYDRDYYMRACDSYVLILQNESSQKIFKSQEKIEKVIDVWKRIK